MSYNGYYHSFGAKYKDRAKKNSQNIIPPVSAFDYITIIVSLSFLRCLKLYI